jgi:DnaJ-domain-containing protein 1
MNKIAIIKKLKGQNKWRLYSKTKGRDGKRRNLGTYDSLAKCKEREEQIQFFKGQHNEDQYTDDKHGKTLEDLSRIATYLEDAGFISSAQELYDIMDAIDGSLDDSCDDIPDAQLNPGNINHTDAVWSDREYSPIDMAGVGQFGLPGPVTVAFLRQVVKTANEFDRKGLTKEADELDYVMLKLAMTTDEAFEVLGVKPTATQDEIKEAWKHKALQAHPDVGGDLEDMKRLNVARDLLLVNAPKSPHKAKPIIVSFIIDNEAGKMYVDLDDYFGTAINASLADEIKGYHDFLRVLFGPKYYEGRKTHIFTQKTLPALLALVRIIKKDPANKMTTEWMLKAADQLRTKEDQNIDSVIGANGLVGSTSYDNQNVGLFQGLSDSYFYTGYQQQEGVFDHGQDKSRNGGGGYNREELERKLTL